MRKLRRDRPCMPTRREERNRNIRLGTRCISILNTYDLPSSKRDVVPSFFLGLSGRLISSEHTPKRQLTNSIFLVNTSFIPHFTPIASNRQSPMILNYFLAENRNTQDPLRSTLMTTFILLTVLRTIDTWAPGRGRKFLIHWQGYPDSEDSWEKEKNINKELIRDYLRGLETD